MFRGSAGFTPVIFSLLLKICRPSAIKRQQGAGIGCVSKNVDHLLKCGVAFRSRRLDDDRGWGVAEHPFSWRRSRELSSPRGGHRIVNRRNTHYRT